MHGDTLKGYWQVFAQYTVMAFGMKNAPATIQRLTNLVLGDIEDCNVYLNDVVVYSKQWEKYLNTLCSVFQRLALHPSPKCKFGKATVTYLRKHVGLGAVPPLNAKVKTLLACPVSTTKQSLGIF